MHSASESSFPSRSVHIPSRKQRVLLQLRGAQQNSLLRIVSEAADNAETAEGAPRRLFYSTSIIGVKNDSPKSIFDELSRLPPKDLVAFARTFKTEAEFLPSGHPRSQIDVLAGLAFLLATNYLKAQRLSLLVQIAENLKRWTKRALEPERSLLLALVSFTNFRIFVEQMDSLRKTTEDPALSEPPQLSAFVDKLSCIFNSKTSYELVLRSKFHADCLFPEKSGFPGVLGHPDLFLIRCAMLLKRLIGHWREHLRARLTEVLCLFLARK